MSVVLLVGAGLLSRVSSGCRRSTRASSDHVLAAEAFTNFSRYPSVDAQLRFYQPVLDRLQHEPGIVAAAVTNACRSAPARRSQTRSPSKAVRPTIVEQAADSRRAGDHARLLQDARHPARHGPHLQRSRSQGRAGRRTHQQGDAALLGRQGSDRFAHFVQHGPNNNEPIWTTIVGVVGDVRQFGLDQSRGANLSADSQSQGFGGRFLIRTQGDPTLAAKVLRDDIHAVDAACRS